MSGLVWEGLSFQNAKVPKAVLIEQEPRCLVLVLMTDYSPFLSLFFKFPELIIFLFLSFSFTQGMVLLALDYIKGIL